MFTEWSWVVGLLIGAAVGSFLNVVIYRMPRGISLSNPSKSFCPKCKHPLGWLDLVPLLSWLILRGRCRHCGEPVSARYFFVEVVTGLAWAGIWWQYLVVGSDPAKAIFFALGASALVAVIFIDWELYLIPDQVNAFLLFVGLAYNGRLAYERSPQATTWGVPSSVAGALVGVGALWGIALVGRLLFRKDAMGHGDIKLARGIGAILFPGTAAMSFGLAVALGAVLGIVQVIAMKPGADQEEAGEQEAPIEPESVGSLLWCGLGYLLCIDVIGLFWRKLYIRWFGEDPFTPVQDMPEFEVERTMIPFGPYLALGAILATVFQAQLLGGWNAYSDWVRGGHAALEHSSLAMSLIVRGVSRLPSG
ncbi:MAG: prepilin peptidase [Fimbriimonas ginsengisoli]|uniref:Prepilin peptidase n=1 Tax=Fimbriimonas ginsengisoli TaxID=1005039 RepID=A0A931PVF0_FIMGI|nr:prepilin peptidase [Fimbriimonas ginsengisoli]